MHDSIRFDTKIGLYYHSIKNEACDFDEKITSGNKRLCTVLLHLLNRIFHLIWSQKTITKSLIKQGDREFCNLDIKWKVSNKNSSVGLLWNFKEWVTSTEFLFFVNYATMIWLTENKCSIQLKQLFEEHTSKQFMISNEQIKRDNGWTCLKISKLLSLFYYQWNGFSLFFINKIK